MSAGVSVERERRGPDSLLEEMSLAQGEFDELGRPAVDAHPRIRLQRSHAPIALEAIASEPVYQSRVITFDPETFPDDADLLKSIKAHGVLEPVYLERISIDMGGAPAYRPIAGHRRIAAARMAGLPHIDAILARSDDDIPAIALAENIGHRALSPYEKALGLMGLKSSLTSMSLRDLSRKSGIPFGTVSSLVSAYEKSSPVLRRIFAEGLAPRTIQELQPVFLKLQEEAQIELAKILTGATQRQAADFRQMVESEVDPMTAARSVMGTTPEQSARSQGSGTQEPEHGSLETDGDRPLPGGKRARTARQPSHLPDPADPAGILALVNRTGASKAAVKRLTTAAQKHNADYTTLSLACAYVAGGGKAADALKLAVRVAEQRKLTSLIFKHLTHRERARKLIAREEEAEVASFLETIFFGAQP